MPTWEQLKSDFSNCSQELQFYRLDYQWGAAGVYYNLQGGPSFHATERFETLAAMAGSKLNTLPDGAIDPEVLTQPSDAERWYEALKRYTDGFEHGFVALQEDDGAIVTGTLHRPADASSVLALKFSSIPASLSKSNESWVAGLSDKDLVQAYGQVGDPAAIEMLKAEERRRQNAATTRIWTPKRVLEVLGVAIGIVAGAVAIYQFAMSTTSVSHDDILLQGEWDSFIVREKQSISAGQELSGSLNPSTWLELSLQNKGEVPAKHIAIKVTGNAQTEGEPSEFFEGQQGQKRSYLLDSIWRARPGVVLHSPPTGTAETVAQSLTTLRVGRFTWGGRNDGLYYLKVVVSASNMEKPAEFEVTMKPFTRQ
ncbi:MAG: hypothetical protein AAF515_10990 [Pseudomonadota bacterium]